MKRGEKSPEFRAFVPWEIMGCPMLEKSEVGNKSSEFRELTWKGRRAECEGCVKVPFFESSLKCWGSRSFRRGEGEKGINRAIRARVLLCTPLWTPPGLPFCPSIHAKSQAPSKASCGMAPEFSALLEFFSVPFLPFRRDTRRDWRETTVASGAPL
jgi:hypothetical protein